MNIYICRRGNINLYTMNRLSQSLSMSRKFSFKCAYELMIYVYQDAFA